MRYGATGYSLIEALVALAILGLGLAGAAGLQAQLLRHAAEARTLTEARGLADGLVAALTGFPDRRTWNRLPAAGTRTHAGLHARYRLAWQWQPEPGLALRRLTVRVDWQSPGGPGHYRLTTLVAPAEPARAALRLD